MRAPSLNSYSTNLFLGVRNLGARDTTEAVDGKITSTSSRVNAASGTRGRFHRAESFCYSA